MVQHERQVTAQDLLADFDAPQVRNHHQKNRTKSQVRKRDSANPLKLSSYGPWSRGSEPREKRSGQEER